MFRGNIISVDTPDNHSIFLLRNELEMDIMNVLYILFSVILPLKYLTID